MYVVIPKKRGSCEGAWTINVISFPELDVQRWTVVEITHGIQQVDVNLMCGEIPNVALTELDSTEDASDLASRSQRQPRPVKHNWGEGAKLTKNMAQVNPRAQ